MSTSDHVFLRTGLPPREAAKQLAAALHGTYVERDGDVYVSRPATGGDGQVGGEVAANEYGAPPDPEPDEISVLDGYDTVFDVRRTHGTDDDQMAEAERLFTEIVLRIPWPALLVHNLGQLVAASHPAHGRRDFPTGTTPDARDRHLWSPYAVGAE